MGRPQIKRVVHCKNIEKEFKPNSCKVNKNVVLSLDQYETIRLIDYENKTQEECAFIIGVSRTTIQSIYDEARKKLATALVESKVLKICGGNVICSINNNEFYPNNKKVSIVQKGEKKMIIAVTYENGKVFQHFGHTEYFKIYVVEDKKVVSSKVISSNGEGHAALAGLLKRNNVDVLVCGGIGGGAINALMENNIEVYAGNDGDADNIVNDVIEGKIRINSSSTCSHHDGEHHCGEHGCK